VRAKSRVYRTLKDHRMRLLPFIASVAFFAASGSAFAADCTKGMLWPYTRNPGDCLTDAEIKAGKTGVYNGPVNTNVDVSSIKPEAPSPSSSESGASKGGFFSGGLFGGSSSTPSTPSAPSNNTGGFFSGGLFGGGSSTPNSISSAPNGNAVACNKGYLWPFVREPGDCLTATEKLTNKTGVYRAGEVTQVSANNPPAGDAGAADTPASTAASAPPPPASSAPTCEKGWFWPFVRKSGDCPTAAEKK
jgi:hypothetical protein